MNGPFSYLGGSLDAALDRYVVATVGQIASLLRPPLALGLSVSVVVRGLNLLRGTDRASALDSALTLATQAALTALALSSALYLSAIVAAVGDLANLLLRALSGVPSDGYAVLDGLEAQGASIATHYIALGVTALPTGGYVDCLTGIAMACVMAMLLVILGGYFVLAKVALALVLSIGPIFIAARAFEGTRRFFDNWINKLFNQVILMALMAADVALVNQIYGHYLDHLSTVSDQTNPVADAIDLMVLSGAVMILALQMPRIAAALSSGTAVAANTFWLLLRAAPEGGRTPPATLTRDSNPALRDDASRHLIA